MPTELVTVNLTRENEKEEWGFILTGGGRDKDVRLFIEQVRNLQNYLLKVNQFRKQILKFSFEPKNKRKYFSISALAS